jgi:glycosyltransferase involved in cell wall biosynthesis
MQNIKKSGHNLQLVLVGKEDYFYQRLKQTVRAMGLEQDVLFPGYVPDKDLGCFYRNAVAYIFPSLYEGFGLPPLEAMQHGCPVLSSDRASMPEVLGDAAGYFDPNDTESIETGIWKILDEPGYSKDLTKRGYMQATQYSWQQCARETKAIYDEALNNSAQ